MINGRKYRVDFLINSIDENGKEIKLIVECDGHDFHEKTKIQAQRDKKRDRELILSGYTVLRFTGSEIFKDVDICSWEVIHTISKLFGK